MGTCASAHDWAAQVQSQSVQIHYSPSVSHLLASSSTASEPAARQAAGRRHPGQRPCWQSLLRASTNCANHTDVPAKTPRCCERKRAFLCLIFGDFIHRIKFLRWRQCFNLFGNIDGKTSAPAAKLPEKHGIKDTSFYSTLLCYIAASEVNFLKLWRKKPRSVCIIFWISGTHLYSVAIKYISLSFSEKSS